ncbi:hypothetical protein KUCAC02_002337 [Chaenocephalus aceratus]|uniref:Uncharacterized protein n=1 Tax=Chaenocephalus aceratus TaxID=36190 RepID=A0ACB9XVV0_CHAAC|nr:hypothetical protein KUCAC02_002337 [Chaenocephalus aceratus]
MREEEEHAMVVENEKKIIEEVKKEKAKEMKAKAGRKAETLGEVEVDVPVDEEGLKTAPKNPEMDKERATRPISEAKQGRAGSVLGWETAWEYPVLTVGEIMAASLAQGGPALNFLMPWCYKFLCTGCLDLGNLDKSDVGGDQYTDLLSKVEAATDTTIQVLTEEILNCGYTGLISLEKKGEIIRAIVLHANLRLFPMLLQIKDGFNLYGLCNIMANYPDICQPLFVPGADADFIISVCQAEFSERGSNKEQVEVTLINHLQDFLQEMEQDKTDSGMEDAALPSLSPKAFLQWITGQGHGPVLQEEKRRFKVNVKFNHHCQSHFGEHSICYPSVAACSRTFTFPVQHMRSYADFKVVLVEAFLLGQEFSLV